MMEILNMMKQITVTSGDWKKNIKIDTNLFDDIYAEACTQIIEKMAKEKQLRLAAVMICWSGNNSDKKLITYNSYKVLINAGLHKQAEFLRKNLYKQTNIDWAVEPIKSNYE